MCLALRPEFQFRLRSASETKSPLAATSVTDPSKERFESSTKRLRPCTIQRPETRPPEHRMLVAGPHSASMRTPVLRVRDVTSSSFRASIENSHRRWSWCCTGARRRPMISPRAHAWTFWPRS